MKLASEVKLRIGQREGDELTTSTCRVRVRAMATRPWLACSCARTRGVVLLEQQRQRAATATQEKREREREAEGAEVMCGERWGSINYMFHYDKSRTSCWPFFLIEHVFYGLSFPYSSSSQFYTISISSFTASTKCRRSVWKCWTSMVTSRRVQKCRTTTTQWGKWLYLIYVQPCSQWPVENSRSWWTRGFTRWGCRSRS